MEKHNILFVGHDLKFIRQLIDHFEKKATCNIRIVENKSHEIDNLDVLFRALPWADIVFCEWGLGNLAWLSRNKLPGQALIVRIHMQEFFTAYLAETEWSQVDQVVLVSPYNFKRFQELFPQCKDRAVFIPNFLDTSSFDLRKNPESHFNLGIVGALPKMKNIHRGLEILAKLMEKDDRYRLFIKSKRPEELKWLIRKPEEKKYYDAFVSKVREWNLEEAVHWDPHGNDVNEWFKKIGFVLSLSDYEAFHLAVAEGMASGAVPLIYHWEGAEYLYPEEFIFESTDQAVERIQDYNLKKLQFDDRQAKQYVKERYDIKVVTKKYEDLFRIQLGTLKQKKYGVSYRDLLNDHLKQQK